MRDNVALHELSYTNFNICLRKLFKLSIGLAIMTVLPVSRSMETKPIQFRVFSGWGSGNIKSQIAY